MPYDAASILNDPIISAAVAYERATLDALDALDIPNREKQLYACRTWERTLGALTALNSDDFRAAADFLDDRTLVPAGAGHFIGDCLDALESGMTDVIETFPLLPEAV